MWEFVITSSRPHPGLYQIECCQIIEVNIKDSKNSKATLISKVHIQCWQKALPWSVGIGGIVGIEGGGSCHDEV